METQIQNKETQRNYIVVCYWNEELDNYRFERDGKTILHSGLEKRTAESLAKKLNDEHGCQRRDITTWLFGRGTLKGTMGEYYAVEQE